MDLTFESINYTMNIIIIKIISDDKETYKTQKNKSILLPKNYDIYLSRTTFSALYSMIYDDTNGWYIARRTAMTTVLPSSRYTRCPPKNGL